MRWIRKATDMRPQDPIAAKNNGDHGGKSFVQDSRIEGFFQPRVPCGGGECGRRSGSQTQQNSSDDPSVVHATWLQPALYQVNNTVV